MSSRMSNTRPWPHSWGLTFSTPLANGRPFAHGCARLATNRFQQRANCFSLWRGRGTTAGDGYSTKYPMVRTLYAPVLDLASEITTGLRRRAAHRLESDVAQPLLHAGLAERFVDRGIESCDHCIIGLDGTKKPTQVSA